MRENETLIKLDMNEVYFFVWLSAAATWEWMTATRSLSIWVCVWRFWNLAKINILKRRFFHFHILSLSAVLVLCVIRPCEHRLSQIVSPFLSPLSSRLIFTVDRRKKFCTLLHNSHKTILGKGSCSSHRWLSQEMTKWKLENPAIFTCVWQNLSSACLSVFSLLSHHI